MRNQLVVDSYYTMESYDDLEYLLCKILFHSAPTLFGGKVHHLLALNRIEEEMFFNYGINIEKRLKSIFH